ncbi:MAG: cupin domain-containing protein [Oligoflexia bacterium]|nr:cupin domain-containing protein [Oligoflexia bacterium]
MQTKLVNKPWGYELIFAITPLYVGKVLHIKKGESLSLQYHNKKDETIHIQKGFIKFQTAASPNEPLKEITLKPGESFHITPKLVHRMIALEDTDILEVSTPELDDVVRLEDRYGRVNK